MKVLFPIEMRQKVNTAIYLQMFVRIQTYKKQKCFLNALVKVPSKQNSHCYKRGFHV